MFNLAHKALRANGQHRYGQRWFFEVIALAIALLISIWLVSVVYVWKSPSGTDRKGFGYVGIKRGCLIYKVGQFNGVNNRTAAGYRTDNFDGSGNSNIKQAVYAHGAGAYVVINSGTYISPDSTGELIYSDAGGHITINGGTFKHSVPKWTINLKDNSGSTIVVKGGSFWEYDPSNSTTEPGDPVSFVAKGYKVVEEERADGTWYTVVPA